MSKKPLKWYVYNYNHTTEELTSFDVFSTMIIQDIQKLKASYRKELKLHNEDKDVSKWIEKYKNTVFSEELRKVVAYRYWSKYEYEISLTTYPPYLAEGLSVEHATRHQEAKLETSKRIDVYDQIMLNFDVFRDYVFENM